MEFVKWKQTRLAQVDLSRKGSIDDHVLDVVQHINSLTHYFTTSSCSGRIIVFENDENGGLKKGCKWIYVTHDLADSQLVIESLPTISDEAVIKFEPMVMHVQCQTIQHAQNLHQAAVASGYRNSGITIGSKGKIMVAIRSTHGMEVPISSKGQLLVTSEYIEFLIENANKKMEENFSRITRFLDNVKMMTEKQSEAPGKKREKKRNPTSKAEQILPSEKHNQTEESEETWNTDEDGFTHFLFADT